MSQQTKSVRNLTLQALEAIWKNGRYSHEVLPDILKKSNLSQQDKSLVVELVNGTLRWNGQLEWILTQFFRGNYKKSPEKLKGILEMTLYQIRFLDKIPDYAAVSEAVDLAKEHGRDSWGRLVNAVLRNYLRNADSLEFPSIKRDPLKSIAVEYSHPEWLISRWIGRYGLTETKRFCEYNNKRPTISLRVNLNKTTADNLLSVLENYGITAESSKYFPDFIKVVRPGNLMELPTFKKGHFVIQDESTALAPLLLSPEKNEIVLDMCAAPGGKTTYLAQLIGNSGVVVAADINRGRLMLLKENLKRLELSSVFPVLADAAHLGISRVNKILLDAPCSGLGVLAKRADLRWKRKEQDIHNVRKIQKKLLENGARLLKKGGVMVYSTCTLEPEENQELITEFLQEHGHFEIDRHFEPVDSSFASNDGFWTSLPFKHGMDGVFAVRLIKN